MRLVVPRRPPHGVRDPFPLPVGEQRNQRERFEQCGSSPLNRPLGPMPLGLEPYALTDLLKRGFYLPAPHKPGDDLPRGGAKVGAQQSLGVEFLLSRINT
jgi:hypothetical protein